MYVLANAKAARELTNIVIAVDARVIKMLFLNATNNFPRSITTEKFSNSHFLGNAKLKAVTSVGSLKAPNTIIKSGAIITSERPSSVICSRNLANAAFLRAPTIPPPPSFS